MRSVANFNTGFPNMRGSISSHAATLAEVLRDEGYGSLDIPFVMLILSSTGPSVGFDHGSPVSPRYANPFAFEGILDRVDIRIVTPPPSTAGDPVAAAHVRQWMSRQ